jgi:hypothetical protein
MGKNNAATTRPDQSAAPAEEMVKLQAVTKISAGGMVIAPGKIFEARASKAEELIAAHVAVVMVPQF